jgi:heme/copper-type cytochrome/quinol oxidase subunit 1
MIELIQQWIWNIGGFLFSISIILLILTIIWSWIINRLSGWHKKEWRANLFYLVQNKKKFEELFKLPNWKKKIEKCRVNKHNKKG